ncbi:hypothetical protein JCM24511_04249 [Saitozyma sp. JCM 24511]|nr:hypothetical protein JCM24511_04249 [Saitozyma sp. JCM 24511]
MVVSRGAKLQTGAVQAGKTKPPVWNAWSRSEASLKFLPRPSAAQVDTPRQLLGRWSKSMAAPWSLAGGSSLTPMFPAYLGTTFLSLIMTGFTFYIHGHEAHTTYPLWSQPTTPQNERTEAVKT